MRAIKRDTLRLLIAILLVAVFGNFIYEAAGELGHAFGHFLYQNGADHRPS
ncbi:hypothetical protein [Lewinella sp. IMCC34183]|uniref:hypothetical protein n=1 Tax=Lewinella sp. IMCC34183 TaxID=2248762 RepID=UPI00130054F8|nr:hypothetical protein [Lewinella sp. IMCC34183]